MSARQPWALDTTEIRLCVAGAEDRERVARFLAALVPDIVLGYLP